MKQDAQEFRVSHNMPSVREPIRPPSQPIPPTTPNQVHRWLCDKKQDRYFKLPTLVARQFALNTFEAQRLITALVEAGRLWPLSEDGAYQLNRGAPEVRPRPPTIVTPFPEPPSIPETISTNDPLVDRAYTELAKQKLKSKGRWIVANARIALELAGYKPIEIREVLDELTRQNILHAKYSRDLRKRPIHIFGSKPVHVSTDNTTETRNPVTATAIDPKKAFHQLLEKRDIADMVDTPDLLLAELYPNSTPEDRARCLKTLEQDDLIAWGQDAVVLLHLEDLEDSDSDPAMPVTTEPPLVPEPVPQQARKRSNISTQIVIEMLQSHAADDGYVSNPQNLISTQFQKSAAQSRSWLYTNRGIFDAVRGWSILDKIRLKPEFRHRAPAAEPPPAALKSVYATGLTQLQKELQNPELRTNPAELRRIADAFEQQDKPWIAVQIREEAALREDVARALQIASENTDAALLSLDDSA